MKKSILVTTLINLGFLMLLGLSGVLASYGMNTLSVIASYLSFIIPLIAFAIYARRQNSDVRIPLLDNSEGLILSAPFIFISLIGVMGISYLTTLILSLLGKSNGDMLSGNIVYLLSRYALLPAVLEELLFRLVPLTLIAPHSKKSALMVSSLMFAFVHCDLFEIPYALFAGVIYMLADLMAGSVLPSIIMHLVNNAVAILWQVYFVPNGTSIYVLALIAALALISVCIVIAYRRKYGRYIRQIFDKGDKVSVDNSFLIFIIFCATVAIFSVF